MSIKRFAKVQRRWEWFEIKMKHESVDISLMKILEVSKPNDSLKKINEISYNFLFGYTSQ